MSLGVRYIFYSASAFAFVSLGVKALPHIPSSQLVFWRGLVCFLITLYYLKSHGIPVWGNNKRVLILRGLAGTVALSCFFYTLHAMPLATAVTIQYMSPIFTVLVAGLIFREGVSVWHWLCALLGFLGVWLIEGFDTRVTVLDAGIGVTGAVASAFAYNSVRSLRKSENEWVVMFYFQFLATLIIIPWAAQDFVTPTWRDAGVIVMIGVLTQVAQLYLTKGYQIDKASKVAPVSYVGVLYAVLFGILFFNEQLPLTTIAGMVIIMSSVIITSLKKV